MMGFGQTDSDENIKGADIGRQTFLLSENELGYVKRAAYNKKHALRFGKIKIEPQKAFVNLLLDLDFHFLKHHIFGVQLCDIIKFVVLEKLI